MLRELTLRNFKLFDDQGITIAPRKITVLIGANGTGKSSVLQALALLKQSAGQPTLLTSGAFMNIGSFQDIVHEHDVSESVEIAMDVLYQDFIVDGGVQPHLAPSGTFRYQASIRRGTLESQVATIGGKDGPALRALFAPLGSTVEPTSFNLPDVVTIDLSAENQLGRPITVTRVNTPEAVADQSLTKTTEVIQRSLIAIELQAKVTALLSSVLTLLERYYLAPAIRGFETLTYGIQQGKQSDDMMTARDLSSTANYVANILASDPDLAEQVSERLNAVLERTSRVRARPHEGWLVAETKSGRNKISLINEAFGLNQLVVPLVALTKLPSTSLIAIEEPESHLHPRAQANLCDVFVDVVTRERKQLILTTHSEHILMSLLTAVAEGRLQPDDLAVYEFQRQGDTARAERLDVNQYGQVAGGLRGFLEADLDEIGNLIQARFARTE